MTKTCFTCCFGHKCFDTEICEHYCSTHSFADVDDVEAIIEQEREAFRAEWMTFMESVDD